MALLQNWRHRGAYRSVKELLDRELPGWDERNLGEGGDGDGTPPAVKPASARRANRRGPSADPEDEEEEEEEQHQEEEEEAGAADHDNEALAETLLLLMHGNAGKPTGAAAVAAAAADRRKNVITPRPHVEGLVEEEEEEKERAGARGGEVEVPGGGASAAATALTGRVRERESIPAASTPTERDQSLSEGRDNGDNGDNESSGANVSNGGKQQPGSRRDLGRPAKAAKRAAGQSAPTAAGGSAGANPLNIFRLPDGRIVAAPAVAPTPQQAALFLQHQQQLLTAQASRRCWCPSSPCLGWAGGDGLADH